MRVSNPYTHGFSTGLAWEWAPVPATHADHYPGVWYSRTAKHSHGHRVWAILVFVVSDMLAARQAGGFFVRQWRDAQMTKEQETVFKDRGIRWSPLLDLPYWNPILFTAIEPMHVFNARLFQTHCRLVWGIDTTALSGDGLTLQSAMGVPRPSDSELCECNNELHRAGQSRQLVEAIVEWTQHKMVSPDTI
ncbi:hypothetical protein BC827DRAFT_1159766 [Russula dissimulans]|nr:hypothetical protein BC827DRAFT_1159766 [Russula dissimulans]